MTKIETTDAGDASGEYAIYWDLGAGQYDDDFGGSLAIWTRYPE